MAIKRYYAKSDTTITNAFKENLTTRGTGSNQGASDILEAFYIYGQANDSSQEKSRILIKFPVDLISTDRSNSVIPASGSVSWYIKMYNAPHSQTVARNSDLFISALSADWDEGYGLDMETYSDSGSANWLTATSASSGVSMWSVAGGDYFSTATGSYTASFASGLENIEIDVSQLVEDWLAAAPKKLANYGVLLRMSDTIESATSSSYTKKFFGRNTEFWFKRPHIEARWNSAKKDDRTNFYYSSSLAPADDNLNTIYFYTYIRGQLKNIPDVGTGPIFVKIYSGSEGTAPSPSGQPIVVFEDYKNVSATSRGGGGTTVVTGGYDSTGIYTASLALTAASTVLTKLVDVWYSGSTEYFTGSVIRPKLISHDAINPSVMHVTSMTNLKPVYSRYETARFRFFTRNKNWAPTIYTKAVATAKPTIIDSGSYRVYRIADGLDVIPFGTSSTLHTQMSTDASGSYFDLDISMLESGYSYGIQLAYYNGAIGSWIEQTEKFKFRVE